MLTRRLPVLAGALGLMVGAGGCGRADRHFSAQNPASGAQQVATSSACPHAPRELAAVLRKGLRRRGELQHVFALRSRASFSDKDPEVRSGVYFVSGNVGAAVFTWAVNVPAWRTGAGLIVAADRATREVSPPRWVVGPRLLEKRYGISGRVDGYARARACANPTRR